MVNIMNILRIWWIEIQSDKSRKRVDVEDREVDLSRRRKPNRGPKRYPGAFPDRVARDEAIHVPKVEDQNRALDRDHAVPNHRGPGAVLGPGVAGNRQADPFPRGGQDQIPDQNTRVIPNHVVDRSQVPEDEAVLDPDEDRDPGVAPNLVAASERVIRDAAEDPLPSSKSHERGHDLYHPDGNRAAVPGLCRSPQIGEVVLGREQFPRIILMSKT